MRSGKSVDLQQPPTRRWRRFAWIVLALLVGLLILGEIAYQSLKRIGWTNYTTANSGLVDNTVDAIAIDDQGRIWVATYGGLSVLSPDGIWTTYTTDNSGLVSDLVRAVAIDDQGRVWVGTPDGLSVLTSDGRWTTYTTDNSGLADDAVLAVAFDGQGRVWAGTGNKGLSVLSPDGSWTTYTTANSGLTDNHVYAVAIDGQGRIWAGTGYRGLSVLSPDGSWTTYTHANSGLADDHMRSVAVDGQGRVWTSTLSSGLSVFDTRRDLPFIRPVIQIWPVLRCTLIPAIMVVGVIWLVQRRRSRPKKAVSPQPVTPPELGEAISPEPSPVIPLQTQQTPPKPEEMGDIEEF